MGTLECFNLDNDLYVSLCTKKGLLNSNLIDRLLFFVALFVFYIFDDLLVEKRSSKSIRWNETYAMDHRRYRIKCINSNTFDNWPQNAMYKKSSKTKNTVCILVNSKTLHIAANCKDRGLLINVCLYHSFWLYLFSA